jgi:hypothetical protein
MGWAVHQTFQQVPGVGWHGEVGGRLLWVTELVASEEVISIISEQGIATVKEPRHRVDMVSCPESFLEADKKLPRFAETKTTFSVYILRVEFNLKGHDIKLH